MMRGWLRQQPGTPEGWRERIVTLPRRRAEPGILQSRRERAFSSGDPSIDRQAPKAFDEGILSGTRL